MTRFPFELAILPGLRLTGKLKLLGKEPAGYSVAFNAKSKTEYVYDRAVLSAKQVKDWTGWEES